MLFLEILISSHVVPFCFDLSILASIYTSQNVKTKTFISWFSSKEAKFWDKRIPVLENQPHYGSQSSMKLCFLFVTVMFIVFFSSRFCIYLLCDCFGGRHQVWKKSFIPFMRLSGPSFIQNIFLISVSLVSTERTFGCPNRKFPLISSLT